MYGNHTDSHVGLNLFLIIAVVAVFLFLTRCENALADADLKKVSPTAKADYQEYNTESWFERKIAGGNRMKKAVYATYSAIAKENGITVYEAVKDSRSRFAGQFKNKFRSLSSFLSLPNVQNAYRTESFGTPAVIVHFTWESCSGSGDDRSCHTEHDEVTIPEINVPAPASGGRVGIDYEGFDMEVNTREPEADGNVDIDYEGFDMVIN